MVGNGDFSWDQACSYSEGLYSEFIALSHWINWLKYINYLASGLHYAYVLFRVYLFFYNEHRQCGYITKSRNTGWNQFTVYSLKLWLKYSPGPAVVFLCMYSICPCLWMVWLSAWFKVKEQLYVVVVFHCLLSSVPPIMFLIICYSAYKQI